jgi:hypothetical protein
MARSSLMHPWLENGCNMITPLSNAAGIHRRVVSRHCYTPFCSFAMVQSLEITSVIGYYGHVYALIHLSNNRA